MIKLNKIKKMNKKAISIPITLIVLLSLALIAYALFTFATSGKKITEGTINHALLFKKLKAQEEVAKYYLEKAAEFSLAETYDEFANKSKFISEECDEINDMPVFCKLKDKNKLENEFLESFKKSFIKKTDEIDKDEGNLILIELRKNIDEGKFQISFDDQGNFIIKIKNLELIGAMRTNKKSIATLVDASFPAEKTFEIEKLGLHTFLQINESIFECFKDKTKTKEQFKICIDQKLGDFDSEIEDKGNYFFVSLKTKKSFVINYNLKKIEFKFLVKNEE